MDDTADKPLASLVDTERTLDGLDVPQPESAASRLRAFEDEAFGKNAVRIGGQIERGSGSLFSTKPEIHRQYAALERLVEAEQQVDAARANLAVAEAGYVEALAAVDTAEGEV